MTEFVHKASTPPQRVGNIQYCVFDGSQMQSIAYVNCTQTQLYKPETMDPTPDGVLDRRMGISDQKTKCDTCLQSLKVCPGHFGVVKLELPVFHVGYFRAVLTIIQCVCKTCSRLMIDPNEKAKLLRRIRTPGLSLATRKQIYKKVVTLCKKSTFPRVCAFCGALNGQVRKVGPLKLCHDRYKGGKDDRVRSFYAEFNSAGRFNSEVSTHLSKAQDDITPLRAQQILKAIPPDEIELLDMQGGACKPENLILTHHLVPPVCTRPVVNMDTSGVTNQDDLTVNLRRIIGANSDMRFGVEKGKEVSSIMEGWDFLQLISALVINSEMPSIQTKAQSLNSKTGRGLCQRLKGKQGRIRGNLSGKRVDFTSRTVISPDPNLEIDQVAVPVEAAMKLTYPEIVTVHNIERLRAAVRRGATSHPGANYVEKKGSGRKQWLKVMRDLDTLANNLEVGDLVERHLMDDDLCLFNRQPSLHRMSIMCHRAKIKPWRTFRFNECVCAPYNADFDGDEMNLHVPQTEEAKAEASILMGVKRNLITPCNGNPLVAATQDFLTAAFLLSNKDRFYDRGSLAHIVTWAVEGADVDIPKPAILKPMELWTGKQILSLLIKENKASNVIVNFETAGKTYSGGGGFAPRHMCPKDGYVVVRNSELLCGTFDKKSLGSGTKDNLFHVLLRDFSPDVAASRMCRLSKLCGRWLGSHGFSIGVTDVWPSDPLVAEKEQLVDNGYKECVDFVRQLEDGTILPQPGFTKEQTLEAKMNGALSKVREKAGSACMSALHFLNAPLIMAKCGSKGGVLNISQMAACVGQQTIMGSRIPNGFIDRTLPHFLVHERSPAAKGFVKNSFFSGLTPTEFFFHTMAGREGLVDTAVKTADTGYMQRRLMKALEDMTVNYDTTVRNSEGIVMQLTYGDDGLDPANMESNNTPVSFSHVLDHSLASHPWRPSTSGEAESERGGEGMLGEDEVVGEVLKWMAKEEYLAVATNMVTRDLLYFFLGKEVDKELSAACSPAAPTPLSPTQSHKDSKDSEIQKEEGAEGKRREALEKERKRKVEVAEKRERAERERVVEVNKAVPVLLELYKEGKLAGKSFGGLVGKIITTRRNFESIADEDEKKDNTWITPALANTASFTKNQIKSFFDMLMVKLRKAVVEPGTPVGAIAGQSIGEPATQMTLKTFHFAGVATMNITLGVPRIKEIINATKTISTPIITAKLVAAGDIRAARVVKARVEKTTLGEISKYIKQTYSPDGCYISVRLDKKAIDALQMDVTASKVKDSILAVPRTKLKPEHVLTTGPYQLQVYPPNSSKDSLFFGLQTLRGFLPTVIIRGIPSITRSVINEVRSKKGKKKYVMMAEGYDLRSVMNTPGVKGEKTISNHIIEVEETLGIEAARSSIIEQIRVTMQHHGISVDIRHVTLLADVMTFKGTILGITRHGVAKMRESVMTLASFETPTDHLFDAAIHGRKDTICGVSDSVIVGNPMPVGTGLFKVLRDSDLGKKIPKPKPTLLSQRKFRVAPDYL